MAKRASKSGHDPGKCGADKRHGGSCTQPAGWGTTHPGIGCCKLHGGSTPNHRRSAQVEIARRECEQLGVPVEIDPAQALIDAVWEAEGNLAFYRAQVQRMAPTVTTIETGPQGASKEVAHPLVVLYHEAERWRAQVAQAALKAGVEERRVRMAEADAARILEAQVAALTAMGLGDRLEEFRRGFVDQLRRVPAALGASRPG